MQYDAMELFRGVAPLLSLGWKVVRLYGVTDAGLCTCGRPECKSVGKHPSGGGWGDRATGDEDELLQWLEAVDASRQESRINLGVRLGPASGLIDVEFDDERAEAAIKRYGLDQIDTPAYASGRSIHRLFLYEDWMPKAGTLFPSGIEVRIGGGEKMAQSVIPPSWHYTRKQYRWLPGMNPEEVAVAKVPPNFREAILNDSAVRGSGKVSSASKAIREAARVGEGGRHAFLVGMASRNAARVRKFTEAEKVELSQIMLALNEVYCDPPKTRDEVIKIVNDQFEWYRRKKEEKTESHNFERLGLEWNAEEHCWEPGQWHLTVITGSPPEYRLSIPNLQPGKPPYCVVMDAETWQSAPKAAAAILSQTKVINVHDPNISRWVTAWSGGQFKAENGEARVIKGLQCSLFESHSEEHPPSEYFLLAGYATILAEYIEEQSKKTTGNDDLDRKPRDGDQPKWLLERGEWGLYFQWDGIIAAAWRSRGIRQEPQPKERRRLFAEILRMSGDADFEKATGRVTESGNRRSYKIMRERHVDALRRLADGEQH